VKLRRPRNLPPLALAAVGVFLGRGAQADTVIDFEFPPPDGGTNIAISDDYGDNISASSDGITIVGFGTPNIGLSWPAPGGNWHYYLDGVWAAVQLDDSYEGDVHSIVFTPNNPGARVVVKSFNFHPYYVSDERFTYDVTLLDGAMVLDGPTTVTFASDGTKEHPVVLDFTAAPGQTVELRLERVASELGEFEIEGDGYNIAIDDIVFAQDPEMLLISGPQVVSVSPADGGTDVAAVYAYRAEIADGDTEVVPGSVQLMLDGVPVSPAPAVSPPVAGVTTVTWGAPGLLPPGSMHTYTLTYDDTSTPAASYIHSVVFTVANYPTLPADYAFPSGSASDPGFTCRTVLAPPGTGLEGTLARAEAQLDGTLIDPFTELPVENVALVGPNPDGSFNVDGVLDFDDDEMVSGHFARESPFPGMEFPFNEEFAIEAWFLLDLPAGYHRLGVNSDDGFEVSVGTPAQGDFTADTVLGAFDGGRAADDTVFDFLVETAGVYRFRLVFFEIGGAASCEFYSVDPATGTRTLINDLAEPAAIRSYRSLDSEVAPPPRITSVIRNGSDLVIEWVDGTPPFQVEVSGTMLEDSWTDQGSPTQDRAATVPVEGAAGYVRVAGQ
jgi:hypothetical protein